MTKDELISENEKLRTIIGYLEEKLSNYEKIHLERMKINIVGMNCKILDMQDNIVRINKKLGCN